MMLNKKNARSSTVILICIAAIFVTVNWWIKKTLDVGQPKQPSVKIEAPADVTDNARAASLRLAAPAAPSPREAVVAAALPTPKKLPKPPEAKDNNIIYEPSIKGNILLQ